MFSIKNIWRKINKTQNPESKDVRDISNLWNKETQEEIKRYEFIIAKVTTAPSQCSFYCRLCNANDITGLGGEYLGDICSQVQPADGEEDRRLHLWGHIFILL